MKKNLIFQCVGPGSGVIPVIRDEHSSFELIELLWHQDSVDAHYAGSRVTTANRILIDQTPGKRKFEAFADAWNAGVIPHDYDAYILADDDLEPVQDWNHVFELFHMSKLMVAQPALTQDSCFSWGVTKQDSACIWRITDFVEVMCPIIAGPVMENFIKYFLEEKTCWGLESLWSTTLPNAIGILDAAPVKHMRPVGSAGAFQVTCIANAQAFREKYSLTEPRGMVLKRVLKRPTPQDAAQQMANREMVISRKSYADGATSGGGNGTRVARKFLASPQGTPSAKDILVSTTLTGNNERLIVDALRSILPHVDICLVIDTGVTDATLEIARKIAGDKLVVRDYVWINDFADARNYALQQAALLCSAGPAEECSPQAWAITVDTDERMLFHKDFDLRASLKSLSPEYEQVLATSHTGDYMKERIFRLPAKYQWAGPTHEFYPATARTNFPGLRFFEIPKNPVQAQEKFKRDVDILVHHILKNPMDARWHFYLAESYNNLGMKDQALKFYRRCADLKGWNEESAWACFRAVQILHERSEWELSLDECAKGLTRHAGFSELAWLAAFANYQLGRKDQARHWAHMSISTGYSGKPALDRTGFKFSAGLYEGPFNVLRFAAETPKERAQYEALYHKAIAARTPQKNKTPVRREPPAVGLKRNSRGARK